MSVSSSVQQVSGGVASVIGGLIVAQNADGSLVHFEIIGYIVAGSTLFTMWLLSSLNRYIHNKRQMSEVPAS